MNPSNVIEHSPNKPITMKLLPTKQYGDPSEWAVPLAILSEAIWDQAEEQYDEDLFTSNVSGTFGREVDSQLVLHDCPNVDGLAFGNSILYLLYMGIVEVKNERIWDRLILTSAFIKAQQQAKAEQIIRTSRLANLYLMVNKTYQRTVRELGTQQTLENQHRVQYSIGVMQNRMLMLKTRADRWNQDKLIDGQLWHSSILDALSGVRQAKQDRHYA